jgi:hypothetical protein
LSFVAGAGRAAGDKSINKSVPVFGMVK